MSQARGSEVSAVPVHEHMGFIFFAFLGAGAIAAVSFGPFLFPTDAPRGRLPLHLGISCAAVGALISFLIGAAVWGTANSFPRGVLILRFLTILLVGVAIGAGIGWDVGVEPRNGEYDVDQGRLGMIRGASMGAVAGLIAAMLDTLLKVRASKKRA